MSIPGIAKIVSSSGAEIEKVLDSTGNVVYQKVASGGIYGVSWKTSSGSEDNTSLTRTDDAANFAAPDPYMAGGSHPGSSPFDTIMPWAGMVKETYDGNVMVKIPKFWYKIDKALDGTLSIKIANYAATGFYVSPAHRARGSESEHDYVWIGRYHCDSNYKSTSGSVPKSNITRATARTGCHNLGSEYWMLDFSMWITIWLLYIVEFANWDSQAMIGYNCGNNSSKQASGTTDSMPYHTGTIKSSRSTYGVGVQYRYIEDPWGNVLDWCDGIAFNKANIYCFENPKDYSDSYTATGATLVGKGPTSNNYIQNFGISTKTGFEWFLYPSSVGDSQTNVPDYYGYDSAGVVLFVGGGYSQGAHRGLFCLVVYYAASGRDGSTGVRLQRR